MKRTIASGTESSSVALPLAPIPALPVPFLGDEKFVDDSNPIAHGPVDGRGHGRKEHRHRRLVGSLVSNIVRHLNRNKVY